jgi:hypothetical protein
MNAGQNHNIKIPNRRLENVAEFQNLWKNLTTKNVILLESKRRLNSGNACYQSVQNLLSSRLLSVNVNIRIYKTFVVLYGYKTLYLTVWKEHRLEVFESRVLRRVFGLEKQWSYSRLEKTAYWEVFSLDTTVREMGKKLWKLLRERGTLVKAQRTERTQNVL